MPLSAWILSCLTGVLLLLSFPPFGLWPLAWIAFVPLFHALDDAPDAKSAANLGAVAGLAFYVPALHWIVKVFGPVGGAFWCAFALWLALHASLTWWAARRWKESQPIRWLAAAAVTWVGIEYFRSEVWKLECTWLALGYSQVPFSRILQTCALFGVYGLSGLIVAFNAGLNLALKGRRAPAIALLGALLVFIGWDMFGPRMSGHIRPFPITVAAVQDESYDISRLDKLSLSPEALHADLLVWPEYAFTVQANDEDRYRKMIAAGLRGTKAVAVLGAAIFPDDIRTGWEQNFAWVMSPDGSLAGRYDKHHPIPFVETRLKANPAPRPVETRIGRIGVEICYDLDFEDTSRLLERQGAVILAVPDLDPHEWGIWQHRQHSAMSSVRAVESGLWIVRAASSGLSQIIDSRGAVRSELPAMTTGVLVGRADIGAGGTLYTRIGWLLPRLCLLLTAAFLAWLAFAAYKARSVKPRIS